MGADPPSEDECKYKSNILFLEIKVKWDVILVHLVDVVDARE